MLTRENLDAGDITSKQRVQKISLRNSKCVLGEEATTNNRK